MKKLMLLLLATLILSSCASIEKRCASESGGDRDYFNSCVQTKRLKAQMIMQAFAANNNSRRSSSTQCSSQVIGRQVYTSCQ